MPALTAWQAIVDCAQVRAGQRVLVHGAAGGVGSFAAQLARAHGAFVAGSGSPSSLEWLRRIGVQQVIDYHDWPGDEPLGDFDVVLDPVGGAVQARSWPLMRRGGLLISLVGEVDAAAAARAGVRAQALFVRYDVDELRAIAELVEARLLRPHVTQVLSLIEARQAMELSQHGRAHGQIVLKVA
jgi:NADPH:quinone reductase-like Zn-dependent oxidoreductase